MEQSTRDLIGFRAIKNGEIRRFRKDGNGVMWSGGVGTLSTWVRWVDVHPVECGWVVF